MSYQPAYTTHFRSLDNTLWEIEIFINDYEGRPLEIKLEGDEPCVIEWQETGKMDVVQSSTCTLRVSNEKDRQMVQLMDHPDTAIIVSRNGKWYWFGHLDDAVYEEPYSFTQGYVTELTFSDFGILNRIQFTLKGKQSVEAIVRDCLEPTGYGNVTFNLYTSLLNPRSQQPITLGMLYINANRFAQDDESWDGMTSKREVLEEILRPLGLRIMQKNAQIYIYDIEYLRDHAETMANYPVWKGTDATLRGSETFGWYEVVFETDAFETLADGKFDYDPIPWVEDERFFTSCYDESQLTGLNMGYYIQAGGWIGPEPPLDISPNAKFFRTRPILTDGVNTGVGWRIKCYTTEQYEGTSTLVQCNLVRGDVAGSIGATKQVLSIETGYLPVVPDRDKYQLRVNLDFILSFRLNPFDNPPDEWVVQQSWYTSFEKAWRELNTFAIMVPVKLEVLDEAGNAIYHYKNAESEDVAVPNLQTQSLGKVVPLGIGEGKWVSGAASNYGDMFLAYYKDYKPDDEDRDPLVTKGGWSTNRIALARKMEIAGSLYRVRDDGEYLPLPPVAGRLRLTVGNGVFLLDFKLDWYVLHLLSGFTQQMYRNPKITLVKDKRREDGISTDAVYERDMINLYADHLKETVKAGCWSKGIAPSARGLLFDAKGNVWEKFTKNGSSRTLEEHRLRCIEDQTFFTQPVISGTAELSAGFCAYKEWSTPGIFLVTELRQDLHQDTEKMTMARIANVGGFKYEYEWSSPICVKEPQRFNFAWSDPICVRVPGYSIIWSDSVCVKKEEKNKNDN